MKGLLLDYGGVLTSSIVDSFAVFCRLEGIDPDAFRRAVLDHAREEGSIFARVEIGAIDQETFDAELATLIGEAAGRKVDPTGLKQRLFAASEPDQAMFDAVKRFKARGIRTALVSNSWGGADYPRDVFEEMFDAVVISGEVGVRKPDAEIYLMAAKLVGLEPSDCVFVDDFRVNVDGAEKAGMKGILHRDSASTLAELVTLL